MKRIISVIIAILVSFAGLAQEKTTHALMDSAITAYNTGMYTNALENYKYISDTLGEESAALYYNMGNAAFKTNDLAAAILFYEKALKINPNDEDIIFNLGLANSRIPDKIEVVPEMLPIRWLKKTINIFTPDQWAYCTIILLAIALVLLSLYFVSRNVALRKIGFWLGTVMLIVCVCSFVVAHKSAKDLTEHNTAIVFSPSVTIKSSPEDSSTDLFVLHEGTKVWVQETLNGWYKIKIANGSVGWIPTELVEKI